MSNKDFLELLRNQISCEGNTRDQLMDEDEYIIFSDFCTARFLGDPDDDSFSVEIGIDREGFDMEEFVTALWQELDHVGADRREFIMELVRTMNFDYYGW